MNKPGGLALRVAAWGLVLVIPLFIISAVIALAVNLQPLYEYGFDRYGVGAVTGLDDDQLIQAAGGLIGYFNSGAEFIDVTVIKDGAPFKLFNEREVIHLYDVKGLFRLDYGVLAGALVYTVVVSSLLLYRRQGQRLALSAFWGGALTVAVVVVLASAAVADFDAFFTRFHLLSFANDFWMLDPRTDYLIMLFPQGFWRDAALFVGVSILALGAGTAFTGWRLIKRSD